MTARRTHVVDPDYYVSTGRDRPWCGAFGARYSPMVEHPHEADCQRCLDRWRVWERQETRRATTTAQA